MLSEMLAKKQKKEMQEEASKTPKIGKKEVEKTLGHLTNLQYVTSP